MIAEIDGLRLLAIGAVIFFHANGNLNARLGEEAAVSSLIDPWFRMGAFGVPLFFVLSGFILALPFAEHHLFGESRRPSLKRYFIRRLTRLEPPYILALLVYFSARTISRGNLDLLDNLGVSSVYLHNIFYGRPSDVAWIAWSLEIEAQFYILAPFLALLFCIPGVLLRRAVIAAVGMAGAFFAHSANVFYPVDGLTILYQLPYFMVGFMLVDVYLVSPSSKARTSWLWEVAALGGLAGVFAVARYDITPALLIPPCVLVGYLGVFRGTIVRGFFRLKLVTVIGGMCYTIYLFHFPVVAAVGRFTGGFFVAHPSDLVRLAAIMVAAVVAVLLCAIPFALVERPAMDPRWPSKLSAFVKRRLGRIVSPTVAPQHLPR